MLNEIPTQSGQSCAVRSGNGRLSRVPEAIDRQIAKLKLESMGIQVDKLTPDQEQYLASWSEGT